MHDFTNKSKRSGSSGGSGGGAASQSARVAPDMTTHQPPGCLMTLGVVIVSFGTGGLAWQIFTTFSAIWMVMTVGAAINYGAQPAVFIICALISVGFELCLLIQVWRIDTAWKKHRVNGTTPGQKSASFRATAVEIVQNADFISALGILAFVVDTVGDYLFISVYTIHAGFAYGALITFLYMVVLYAMTTLVYVRGWEYVWAGWAAARNEAHSH
jgi:hypothetical protein